jgi:hypothetical protein
MLAILLGCGLRRREVTNLDFVHMQRREEHWAIVDLIGKGGHIRTVPVPDWVKQEIEVQCCQNFGRKDLSVCLPSRNDLGRQHIGTDGVARCQNVCGQAGLGSDRAPRPPPFLCPPVPWSWRRVGTDPVPAWATSRCRRRSDISVASNAYAELSTTGSALSRARDQNAGPDNPLDRQPRSARNAT